LGYGGIEKKYLRAPNLRLGLGTIFGVMPHLVAIKTCTLGFVSKISFALAPFERSPLLHKTSEKFSLS
jgi:hypothetical protein